MLGLEKFIETIVRFSRRRRSPQFKVMVMLFGATNLFIVIPFVFFQAGVAIEKYIEVHWPRPLEIVISILSIVFGLLFLMWSVVAQLRIGQGTPVPLAPTQKLITTGPYRLCRNPIHLGAIIYYLGVGTFFGSLTIGIICFLLGLIIMSFYNNFVEEKELLLRFGKEYEEYKKKTPFLVPKIRKKVCEKIFFW